jgi:hypothetical protein
MKNFMIQILVKHLPSQTISEIKNLVIKKYFDGKLIFKL